MLRAYRPDDPCDERECTRLYRLAFGANEVDNARFLRRAAAHCNTGIRIVGEPTPSAIAIVLNLGQWFGGRCVPMAGIHAVAVAPEARGRGLAPKLMEAILREQHEHGTAISCLYASVQTLYQRLGYEHAGLLLEWELPLRSIGRMSSPKTLERTTSTHVSAIRACQERFSAAHNGALRRDEYLWDRVASNAGLDFDAFVVPGATAGEIAGYVHLATRFEEPHRRVVVLSDVAFLDGDAGRSILGFIADFATTFDTLRFRAGPNHPLLGLIPQQWKWKAPIAELWLLRITNLASAIAARGYPHGLQTSFRIELDDPLLPAQAGTWKVEIANGEGVAQRTRAMEKDPLLRCGARGLAAIWSGFLTPLQAQQRGLISCDEDEALARAGAAFGGQTACLTERF